MDNQNLNIKIVELNRQLAQATHQLELTQTALKQKFSENKLSDDDLQAQHDPNNPSAMMEYARNFTENQEKAYLDAISGIEKDTNTFIESKYNNDEIKLQTELAKYVTANKSKLTYEQLTKDTPARLMDDFKSGKLKDYNELFQATEQYHQNAQVYQPQAPTNTPQGDMPTNLDNNPQVTQQAPSNVEVSSDDVLS